MDEFQDRISKKLDKVIDKQDEQHDTLVRNTITLEEHVRRTNKLEEKVEEIEKPLIWLNISSKVALFGAAIVGAIYAVLQYLDK